MKLAPHHAYCAVCRKPGRTGFGFDELLNPKFKLTETMTMISGFRRKDGTYPFGKIVRYVHNGNCHNTFQGNKNMYRRMRT